MAHRREGSQFDLDLWICDIQELWIYDIQELWICDIQASIRAHDNPGFKQSDFQFFNDDGNEANATTLEAIDADTTQNVDSDFDIQLRFLVKETAGNAATNDVFKFQHDPNGTGFVDTTTTSTFAKIISTNLTDLADTTQRVGVGTFLTPNDGQSTDGSAGGGDCDYAGNDEAEFVCSIRILAADVSDLDTIDFQLTNADLTLEGGQANPRFNVTKTAPSTIHLVMAPHTPAGR